MSDYSYFCSTDFGLYRCADWHYDNSVPTWAHIGQTMNVSEFALDLNDPDEFQAAHHGGLVYVRRPTHYGDDDWHEVYSVADAVTQFGGPPYIEGFRWVEINSASGKEGHMYVQAHTGLNAGARHIYILTSTNYGGSWSRSLLISGTIRATGGIWAGRVTGDNMYASYNGHGLISSCKIRYSTNEGSNWAQKQVYDTSLWVTRVLIDPSAEGTSFSGNGVNGPNLRKATTVSGGYTAAVKSDAGLAIFNGYGGGWISASDGNYVRTIRDNVLYYSDTGGGSGTWSENNVTDVGHGATFERAMWGHDATPNWVGVASRTEISMPYNNYHLLKSTQNNGGAWYDKAGAHASTADTGGGDSIPYNCGGVAENGVYLIIPRRVFTSVVAMRTLPTAGTVYADGVQMGTLPTGGTVYASGVEQESPRQT